MGAGNGLNSWMSIEKAWRYRAPSHPQIIPIPAFDDNYIWLIRDPLRPRAAVVDPGDAAPVIAALQAHGLELSAVLVTHHHRDHVGGLAALRSAWPTATVYGPRNPAIAGIDRRVSAGDRVSLDGFDVEFTVLEVPGHTLDHIAFHAERLGTDPRPILFCGDTLFAGGCGRLFEGEPAQMLDSLAQLAALPAQTRVYCAHEYTLSNLRFACAVEPGNAELADRMSEAIMLRAAGIETVPSDIAAERATNPFLRWDVEPIRQAARQRIGQDLETPAQVFATIRQWKNEFRG